MRVEKLPPHTIEKADPELFADFFVRWAEDTTGNIAQLADACGLPRKTAQNIVRRLETRYQPVAEVVKRGTTKALLEQMEEKLPMLLDGITKTKIKDAQLREIAVAFGVIAEKRQLFKGEPTQILSQGERQNLDDLAPLMMKELHRRGMVVDADFHEVASPRVSPPMEVQEESVSKTAARMASRENKAKR